MPNIHEKDFLTAVHGKQSHAMDRLLPDGDFDTVVEQQGREFPLGSGGVINSTGMVHTCSDAQISSYTDLMARV